MPKLIKVHGTSGAGKTTVVLNLMERATEVVSIMGPKKVEAYRIALPGVVLNTYVLGSYENTCGGMDTVSEVQAQIEMIQRYAGLGHVIYEGLLMSTYYGALGKAVEPYGQDHVWAFLDTPMDTCIERVKQRRIAAGNTKPLNERNTRERQKAIDSLRKRVTILGYPVMVLAHDGDTSDQILEVLK